MIPFMWHSGKGKINGAENRPVVARGWGWREADYKGATWGHLWGDGAVPHVDCGSVYTVVWVCENAWNCAPPKSEF